MVTAVLYRVLRDNGLYRGYRENRVEGLTYWF